MTFVIAEPCVDVLDKACLHVCPVSCIAFDQGLVTASSTSIRIRASTVAPVNLYVRWKQFIRSLICLRDGRCTPPLMRYGFRTKQQHELRSRPCGMKDQFQDSGRDRMMGKCV